MVGEYRPNPMILACAVFRRLRTLLSVKTLLALLPLLLTLSAPEPHEGRALPARLRNLPVGILVLHHPNPVYPVRKDGEYVWRHDTEVRSLVGDLRLLEYGAYLYGDAGWQLRVVLAPDLFAKVYRCPGARLRKGCAYTDPDNARHGQTARAGDALWFFVAEDAQGRRYKGTALIETEAERTRS